MEDATPPSFKRKLIHHWAIDNREYTTKLGEGGGGGGYTS